METSRRSNLGLLTGVLPLLAMAFAAEARQPRRVLVVNDEPEPEPIKLPEPMVSITYGHQVDLLRSLRSSDPTCDLERLAAAERKRARKQARKQAQRA